MCGQCIKCGDCCEYIAVGFTLDEVRSDPDFPDRDFILHHWTPATPSKKKLNPWMKDKCFNGFNFFSCNLFDSQTRLCKDYETRAVICRKYPTSFHNSENLISARCGFMPEELRQ